MCARESESDNIDIDIVGLKGQTCGHDAHYEFKEDQHGLSVCRRHDATVLKFPDARMRLCSHLQL
jgi:hypothetical protein